MRETEWERTPPPSPNIEIRKPNQVHKEFQEYAQRIYNLSNNKLTLFVIGKSEATKAITLQDIKTLGPSRWVKLFG